MADSVKFDGALVSEHWVNFIKYNGGKQNSSLFFRVLQANIFIDNECNPINLGAK